MIYPFGQSIFHWSNTLDSHRFANRWYFPLINQSAGILMHFINNDLGWSWSTSCRKKNASVNVHIRYCLPFFFGTKATLENQWRDKIQRHYPHFYIKTGQSFGYFRRWNEGWKSRSIIIPFCKMTSWSMPWCNIWANLEKDSDPPTEKSQANGSATLTWQ